MPSYINYQKDAIQRLQQISTHVNNAVQLLNQSATDHQFAQLIQIRRALLDIQNLYYDWAVAPDTPDLDVPEFEAIINKAADADKFVADRFNVKFPRLTPAQADYVKKIAPELMPAQSQPAPKIEPSQPDSAGPDLDADRKKLEADYQQITGQALNPEHIAQQQQGHINASLDAVANLDVELMHQEFDAAVALHKWANLQGTVAQVNDQVGFDRGAFEEVRQRLDANFNEQIQFLTAQANAARRNSLQDLSQFLDNLINVQIKVAVAHVGNAATKSFPEQVVTFKGFLAPMVHLAHQISLDLRESPQQTLQQTLQQYFNSQAQAVSSNVESDRINAWNNLQRMRADFGWRWTIAETRQEKASYEANDKVIKDALDALSATLNDVPFDRFITVEQAIAELHAQPDRSAGMLGNNSVQASLPGRRAGALAQSQRALSNGGYASTWRMGGSGQIPAPQRAGQGLEMPD